MKTILMMVALAAILLPFAACDTTHVETTHRNWDGSVTHKETTVQELPNGTTTVEQNKTTTR